MFVLALVVWLLVGQPWWAPLVGALVAVSATALLPGGRGRGVELGALGTAAAVVSTLSVWAWLLLAGVLLVVGAALPPAVLDRAPMRFRRAVLVSSLVMSVMLVAVGVIGLVVEQRALGHARAAQGAESMDRTRAQLLPRSPSAAVHALLGAIAHDDPTAACWSLTTTAAEHLATAVDAQSCPTAISTLHDQVTDPIAYRSPDSGSITTGPTSPDGETSHANACSLTWTARTGADATGRGTLPSTRPGPQVGMLDLHRPRPDGGYLITGYRSC
ncbi:hypothetical protein [Pseudonocardia humida]|uniref:Uncharacterized protein n=1 Tax=Pseudonocardia humida TaxID=2800819 RepID=A0ABT1A850_9PSEU|nr:hypothetical protein [Pseudonocardia humida]MCO1659197.1 hypothetical protein [Pseudonocardia humida]